MRTRDVCVLGIALAVFVVPAAARAAVEVTVKSSTLKVVQTASDGAIVVSNGLEFGDFSVTENGVLVDNFPARKNLVVQMLSGSLSDLDVDLANALPGKLTIVLGDGSRAVTFPGATNVVGGNLKVTGGAGGHVVLLSTDTLLTVGGDLTVDLGDGVDTVTEGAGFVVLGDLEFRGVNEFQNSNPITVAGDFRVDVSGESEDSTHDIDAGLVVGGDAVYRGSDGRDVVQWNAGTRVDGDVDVDLGASGSMSEQIVNLAETRVGDDVRVRSGASAGGSEFDTSPETTLAGDLDVGFGAGPNQCFFVGTWASKNVRYSGGGAVDDVTIDLTAPAADVEIRLKGGADIVTLEAFTMIDELFIDFGPGSDVFVDFAGPPHAFDVEVKNLP